MDVAKLEKMKVVDLRNELQARGLDTKGVKAVLVERLRAVLEGGDGGGGGTPGTPGTPGRRSRRTRSMTRSPSPSPIKINEPALETLEEESVAVQGGDDIGRENKAGQEEQICADPPETVQPSLVEDAADQEKEDDIDAIHEVAEVQAKEDEQKNAEANGAPDPEEDEEDDEGQAEKNTVEQDDKQMDVDDRTPRKSSAEKVEDLEKNQGSDEEAIKNEQNKAASAAGDNSEPETVVRKSSHSRSGSRSRSRSHSKERCDRGRSRSRSRSKSRSRSRTPKRRSGTGAGSHGSPSKTTEEATNPEDEPTIEDKQFGLSWFDSDLHLRIDPVTFTSAKPMTHEIYSLVWSGVRTNYGVREGKVCFEVRLAEETQMTRSHQFRDEPHVRGFRVGFSMPDSTLLLGESENSFAYCESGRKALNSEFTEYAKPYQLDDVIGCYLDLENTPATIKYTLNGEDVGVAFEFDKSILGETGALFPHIVTKGYEFHVNFADNENLLVNVERPKRMRRKPRKEKPSDKDKDKDKETLTDSNQENWKVVDETKPDDDEKPDEELKKGSEGEVDTALNDVEMKESNEKAATPETVEGEKKSEDNIEDAEADKSTTSVAGEDEKGSKTTENGEGTAVAEKKESAETAIEQPTKKDAASENDDGPSPNKRQKLDSERRESVVSEDEYEEVVPEQRDPVSLLPDYELIALIPEEKYVPGPQRPESRKECEVILLVGLPGAGKTHWTLNHVKENPEKRYHIIGADALISKMTIDGTPRKTIHKGRWDRVYEWCINSLSPLEEIATKRRRNFILDQTNAYASAQRRKMKGFGDFKRIAVVCIPTEEEFKRRNTEKTEKGNAYSIRESTLNNLRANLTLPSLEFGWFDDIIYTDLSGDEAKEEVKKYNEKGKKALDANPSKRYRRDNYQRDDRRHNDGRRDFNRWNDRRGGHSGGGGNNRWGGGGGGGGGGGSGGYRSGWRDDRSYGSGAGGGGRGYDNRNNRYSNGPQNWMHNNRGGNRYDDRYNRSGGGGAGRYDSGGRYDAYGGGGGSRDYRDRDRDRNAGGGRRDNYRSGGGGGGNQRDFRPGHRDNRTEDSRGGYERSTASNDGYGQYNSGGKIAVATTVSRKSSTQSTGKWSSYAQHPTHQHQQQPHPQQQQQHHAGGGGTWQQHHQYQQQPATPQQYWGYNEMQGYGNQQQQWQSADPNQQQDWMSWWQQQQQGAGATDANQYWSQYSYQTQPGVTGGVGGAETDASSKK